MIFKKCFLLLIIVFLVFSFISISVSAETSNNSFGGSDYGGGGSEGNRLENYVPFADSDTISFSFTFLNHPYTFHIPFPNTFMPIVRDIVFYFLLAKSIFTKWKSLPAIIGQVPVIGPSDAQQVAMYNSMYNR